MNCKPGDLAVLVKSEIKQNIGVIVEVLRPYSGSTFSDCGTAWNVRRSGDSTIYHCLDAWLRPIRDNDGEDETLTWAGKPNHIEVTQ